MARVSCWVSLAGGAVRRPGCSRLGTVPGPLSGRTQAGSWPAGWPGAQRYSKRRGQRKTRQRAKRVICAFCWRHPCTHPSRAAGGPRRVSTSTNPPSSPPKNTASLQSPLHPPNCSPTQPQLTATDTAAYPPALRIADYDAGRPPPTARSSPNPYCCRGSVSSSSSSSRPCNSEWRTHPFQRFSVCGSQQGPRVSPWVTRSLLSCTLC